MTTPAQELRALAFHIEQITRESRVASIANEQVRALCDYLTLRARIIEMQGEKEQLLTAQYKSGGYRP